MFTTTLQPLLTPGTLAQEVCHQEGNWLPQVFAPAWSESWTFFFRHGRTTPLTFKSRPWSAGQPKRENSCSGRAPGLWAVAAMENPAFLLLLRQGEARGVFPPQPPLSTARALGSWLTWHRQASPPDFRGTEMQGSPASTAAPCPAPVNVPSSWDRAALFNGETT